MEEVKRLGASPDDEEYRDPDEPERKAKICGFKSSRGLGGVEATWWDLLLTALWPWAGCPV